MPTVELSAGAGRVPAYLAVPVTRPPWPAVLTIHDVLGLTDGVREHCHRLAAGGFLALAPDLYAAGGGLRCVAATIRASRTGTGRAYADIDAARRWLAVRDDCTGRIGIIGFCMGGGFALLCASAGGFAVSPVNYGFVPDDAERRLAGSCPIVASFGARDRLTKGHAERLDQALQTLGVEHDVKTYRDVRHSFLDRHNYGPLLTPIVRVAGFGYDRAAAEDAWRRIFTFFYTALGQAE